MDTSLELLYEKLLLEKDHRRTMLKFGIPEDVAEYLHAVDDKYSLWFANQFKDMPEYQRAANKISFIATRRQQMQQVLDWIKGLENVNIKSYKWDDALRASEEWHKEIAKTPDEQFTDLTQNVEEYEDGNGDILKVYQDGYYWIDLKTSKSREEGDCMGHCGNTDADTIWSLRHISDFYNKDGRRCNSYVTVALNPDDGIWRQAKGKANRMPNEEYWSYIVDIFVENNILEYQSEYAASADFGVEEFKAYLEENPESYPNADEIMAKLNESGVESKADKLFEEYRDRFTNVYVDYYVEDDYIYGRGGHTIRLTDSEMPELRYLNPRYLETSYGMDVNYRKQQKEFIKTIDEVLQKMNIYVSPDWEYSEPFVFTKSPQNIELDINLDFEIDRDGYGDELDMFKNFLDEMDNLNDKFGESDFTENFIELFKEKLEEYGFIDYDKPLPKPEHPGQMKFNFAEGSTFKQYAKHVGMI